MHKIIAEGTAIRKRTRLQEGIFTCISTCSTFHGQKCRLSQRRWGNRGSGQWILVHVGTNNAEGGGPTAIVRKHRQLIRTAEQARVEQIIMLGILPVMGSRS